MKKIVILDLHGVVFYPIDRMVIQSSLMKYNLAKSAALFMCYKTGLGKKFIEQNLSDVVYDSARDALPIPGAFSAIQKIANIPNTQLNVCSRSAFPARVSDMENHYRTQWRTMDLVAHYELISPLQSKRAYLSNVNAANVNSDIYVVDNQLENLVIAHDLRMNPVLISDKASLWRRAKDELGARTFMTLQEFANYLERRK